MVVFFPIVMVVFLGGVIPNPMLFLSISVVVVIEFTHPCATYLCNIASGLSIEVFLFRSEYDHLEDHPI